MASFSPVSPPRPSPHPYALHAQPISYASFTDRKYFGRTEIRGSLTFTARETEHAHGTFTARETEHWHKEHLPQERQNSGTRNIYRKRDRTLAQGTFTARETEHWHKEHLPQEREKTGTRNIYRKRDRCLYTVRKHFKQPMTHAGCATGHGRQLFTILYSKQRRNLIPCIRICLNAELIVCPFIKCNKIYCDTLKIMNFSLSLCLTHLSYFNCSHSTRRTL